KGSGGMVGPPEPRYLSVRRRPGYSWSGCTPAEPDSASPGGSLITPFMEERYATDLKEGRTVRSVPAPNCGNQGTSVTSVLQAIDGCGTRIPGCTLTPLSPSLTATV